MHEVAKNVFCVRGTDVNWLLVREGRDLTLIDSGWLGDVPALERSIRAIGCRPGDVCAVLLTHAHLDHVGGLNHLRERYGVPVHMDPREVPHARREYLEQVRPAALLQRAWRPRVLAWSLRILRAGATRDLAIPHAEPFPHDGPLDLPGRPVPVACHGHTSGHSAYYLPDAGVVATGDALVTGHPTSPVVGPQLLPCYFSHSARDSVAALDSLAELDAGVLVPGHGDPWYGPLSSAVAEARRRAASSEGTRR
ncbi:MBL fold metallo-hydrolase [Streptoalloteichus hindustanus]|uniref:Glyoxylase, beta-lactamase superfamily II n=1 Tax=Streptoalloteichus hindustanus TaxID=2017 RepID=A0A1M5MWH9_STRHI|nr:MBL fold metallo-hydrolase [Streptoalloteichus hindustanus]SHG81664.1 Glyoxylase, beta-lactamase superfamily II [Streptoalloteichus hindustanus]